MIRRLPAPRSDALPSDVRRGLIKSVFADFRSMVYGGVITSLTGVLITFLTRNWASAVATVAIVGVTAARLKLTREYHSRLQRDEPLDVGTLERTYLLGTCAFLLSIGFLTFAAINATNDPFILVAACSTAIIHALSIAVRNFAVQYGVRLQIAVVAIPLAAAFIVKGGLFPLNVVMLVLPLCMFIHGSAARLREILLSQIAFRTESEPIANQFDFAINNMSHGMCMVSAEKRILVSNAKFSQFLALELRRRSPMSGSKRWRALRSDALPCRRRRSTDFSGPSMQRQPPDARGRWSSKPQTSRSTRLPSLQIPEADGSWSFRT